MAQRLAQPELNNQVYLSLRSGIRVSPRYHPIRNVPSDFLRNRLLLSFHRDLRNGIGQRFVEFRIRSREILEFLFSSRRGQSANRSDDVKQQRKLWSYRLTKAAKDRLFNMYHNKSDDFLDSVAEGRITIIGAPLDSSYRDYRQFDEEQTLSIEPDLVVPAVGYQSCLGKISRDSLALADFYLGVCHVQRDNVFAIGFTRPIIGNIPSMSEVQARYACGLLSGRFSRPAQIAAKNQRNRENKKRRYPHLDTKMFTP